MCVPVGAKRGVLVLHSAPSPIRSWDCGHIPLCLASTDGHVLTYAVSLRRPDQLGTCGHPSPSAPLTAFNRNKYF